MKLEELRKQKCEFEDTRDDLAARLAKVDAIIANLDTRIKEQSNEATLSEM